MEKRERMEMNEWGEGARGLDKRGEMAKFAVEFN